MQLGVLLTTLAAKAGIAQDNEHLINFLSKSEIANTEVSDEIATAINGNLFDLDAAKANHLLKSHFTRNVLDAFDKNIDSVLSENGLPEEIVAAIKGEPSTYKRIPLLVSEIKKLQESKAGSNKTDKAEIQKQIDDLQAALATSKSQLATEKAQLQKEYDGKLTEYQLNSILASKKYANVTGDDETSKRVAVQTANLFLQESLKSDKAAIARTEHGFKLVQADNPDVDFYDKNNTKPDFSSYVDGVLARHKLLQVKDSQGSDNQHSRKQPVEGGAQENTDARSHIKDQLKGFVKE